MKESPRAAFTCTMPSRRNRWEGGGTLGRKSDRFNYNNRAYLAAKRPLSPRRPPPDITLLTSARAYIPKGRASRLKVGGGRGPEGGVNATAFPCLLFSFYRGVFHPLGENRVNATC